MTEHSERQQPTQVVELPLHNAGTAPHNSAVPSEFAEGARVGRFAIERRLGGGGFGTVYLAHDADMNRPVALKFPNAPLLTTTRARDDFLREARCAARLRHERIVTVYDFGQHTDGRCFIVYEFIPGSNLADVLKQRRLSVQQIAIVMAQAADALNYAHQQGLVHRDIKPENILLDDKDRPYVADFGLAIPEEELLHGKNQLAGTPSYMSPEQIRGEGHRIDGRTDIYSLGVVLYQALCGRRPFEGKTVRELAAQISEREPRPPRLVDASVPRELERICLKAMSKRVGDRYITAADMAEELRLVAESAPHTVLSGTPEQIAVTATPAPASQPTMGESAVIAPDSQPSTPPLTPIDQSRHVLAVVPKGLRSFDAADADFFLQLLPGSRDRDGLPDAIRFWKSRIEQRDADQTFTVGLIYGPSGCGKSSLVKAGLLPRLVSDVTSIYLEATPDDTEIKLIQRLDRLCPGLRASSGDLADPASQTTRHELAAMIGSLRRESSMLKGRKLLIVLDQFEQWLQARGKSTASSELVAALRQANGRDVQFVLMIRDDFWLATARLFQDLEIPLVEGHNLRLVDLFDQRHARRVLQLYGRAYDRLPEHSDELTADQATFLDQAIAGLSDQEKVISVRLSLFADMMKSRDWTPASLIRVGGTEGVGVAFLEETFSSRAASPEHRVLEKPIRAVLASLLPDSGTDIKGRMRSRDDLLKLSGLSQQPALFERLLKILDGELRIVTPTESSLDPDAAAPAGDQGSRYYQLTHDYLVAPLRLWLTQKDRQSFRGRARLSLLEHSSRWDNFGRKRSDLPGFFSLTAMLLGTTPHDVNSRAADMLRSACLRKLPRRLCETFLILWPLLLVSLATLSLCAIDLNRHAAADLFDAELGEVASYLSIAGIGALLTGILFLRRATTFSLWWPWRHGWSIWMRSAFSLLTLGSVLLLPLLMFLKLSSLPTAVGAFAERQIATRLEPQHPDDALTHLDRGLREFPTPAMFAQRGNLQLALKKYEAAIADFTRVLPDSSNESPRPSTLLLRLDRASYSLDLAVVHFRRGTAQRLHGAMDAASSDFERVLELRAAQHDLLYGQAALQLWRIAPAPFWKLAARETITDSIGKVALQDADPLIRRDAFRILGQLGHQAGPQMDVLLQGLKDPNEDVQLAAAFAISLVDVRRIDAAYDLLKKSIISPDEHLRKQAVHVISWLGKGALPLLPASFEAMEKYPEYSYLGTSAQRVAKAIGVGAVPELRSRLNWRDPQFNNVLSTIEQLGPAAAGLAPDLETLLRDPNLPTETNGQVINAISALGPSETRVLIRAFAHSNEMIRKVAAQSLSNSYLRSNTSHFSTNDLSALNQSLDSSNVAVRVAVAQLLWYLEHPVAPLIPALLAGLKHEDQNIRETAAQTLQLMGTEAEDAIVGLEAALLDTAPRVRFTAAQALWQIEHGSESAISSMIAVMQNKEADSYIRQNAAALLLQRYKQATPESAARILKAVLQDGDEQIIGNVDLTQVRVPELLPSLQHDKAVIRARALQALMSKGQIAREALPAIHKALQDNDGTVRQAAISALGVVGRVAPETIPMIRRSVSDSDAKVRHSAADTLWNLERDADSVIPVFRESLRSTELAERLRAVNSLSAMGRRAAPAAAELRAATTDQDSNVRLTAASVLWELGTHQDAVVEFWAKEVTAPGSAIQNQSLWQLLQLLQDVGDDSRSFTPLILSRVVEPSTNPNYYWQSAENHVLLNNSGNFFLLPGTMPVMTHWLRHPHRAVRRGIAGHLKWMGDEAKEAVPALLERLQDDDRTVRLAAAQAIWQIDRKSAPVLPILMECLNSAETELQTPAINTLQDIGPDAKSAIPNLTRLLESPDRAVRMPAAKALWKIGCPAKQVVPIFLREVQNRRSPTRVEAATALGEIGPAAQEALPALQELFREEDRYDQNRNSGFRSAEVIAIVKVGRRIDDVLPDLLNALKSDAPSDRIAAASVCQTIGADAHVAIPALVEGLQHEDSSVRDAVLNALAEIGPRASSAVAAIRERFQNEREEDFVRIKAGWALWKIEQKSETLVPFCVERLRNGERQSRLSAAWTLNELGPAAASAAPALTEALHDPSYNVRQTVKESLKKISAK